MTYDESCDFCRIGQGKDTAPEIIWESPNWVAFFPQDPATPGHTLIIPRVHVPDLWSLDVPLAGELIEAVIRIGNAIRDAVTPAGMNLISSAGEAAEQTVFHLHLHVLPRYPSDGIDIWPPKKTMSKRLERHVADAIREACRS